MSQLRRKEGTALWQQIEAALTAEIAAGRLTAGERMPTEPDLMARFGVSRFTVRQALAALERRGLVRAEQGRGTFVHRDLMTYPLSGRTRYSRNLLEQGIEPGIELLSHVVIAARAAVAESLQLRVGQKVIQRRAIGTGDGMPVELAETYLPAARFPDFAEMRLRHKTASATLAAYGIKDYVRVSTVIEARLPTAEEARALRQPESSPVFQVTKIDADMAKKPIVYAVTLWAADRVAFSLDA